MIAFHRVLSIKSEGGLQQVAIDIALPFDDRGSWRCNFTIGWPEGPYTGYGMGTDAVQAIRLTFGQIAIMLYASTYHRDGILFWQRPGDGYGFPLPYDGRDVAIGNDKRL